MLFIIISNIQSLIYKSVFKIDYNFLIVKHIFKYISKLLQKNFYIIK